MKKHLLLLLMVLIPLLGFGQKVSKKQKKSTKTSASSSAQTQVSNLLPMYGPGKKSPELIEIDNLFIQDALKSFEGDPAKASEYYTDKAWEYFWEKDLDTAMKRFNQGWLLDKNNYGCYWGFAVILGTKEQYEESVTYFEKALSLNPNEARLYSDFALTYFQLYFKDNNQKHLNSGIALLEKGLLIDPNYAKTHAQLAAFYLLLENKPKASHHYKIAMELDPQIVPLPLQEEMKNL
ncbi:MAG: hypothetical protein C4K58_04080 [Flavobacteriaceae bacterium]|nr:MAG: hypothetical protein C4K58_04080 [Flavobacteriaceae bacterium]